MCESLQRGIVRRELVGRVVFIPHERLPKSHVEDVPLLLPPRGVNGFDTPARAEHARSHSLQDPQEAKIAGYSGIRHQALEAQELNGRTSTHVMGSEEFLTR